MRTQKEQEEERYFGIQQFDTLDEAFDVMEGSWGEKNAHDSRELFICTDDQFGKAILLRAAMKYMEYKEGKITLEECDKALLRSDECSTDYLVDFDFFLYSKLTKSFFTSRMSFKDDGCHVWNDRQWGYFWELVDIYNFQEKIDKAIKMVDKLWDDYEWDTVNEICAELNIYY